MVFCAFSQRILVQSSADIVSEIRKKRETVD